MAGRSGARGRTASTSYRLPTDGDHPVLWTALAALTFGGLACLWSVIGPGRRRSGLGLPLPVGLAIGLAVALVVALVYGWQVRRAPRGLALRVGPEGLAFTQGRTERWAVSWDAVTSAGIVHSALPKRRYDPAPSYLRLELEDGTAPADRSLHPHEGAWWFPLAGFDTAARLHHDLGRHIPGRVRRVETEAHLPPSLAAR